MCILGDAQVEVWLTQEVLAKHKRVGGISTRYYGTRTNGPPSSVSEEKVRVFFISAAICAIIHRQVVNPEQMDCNSSA